jgi:rhodanese-related sulfurtransferase
MNVFRLIKAMFTPIPRLRPAVCADRVRAGSALLVDVREPSEWEDGYAKGAALLPLSDLNGPRTQWTPFLAGAANRELILYCGVGGRAAIAAKLLATEGYRTANGGGFSEWCNAGWPTQKPAGR